MVNERYKFKNLIRQGHTKLVYLLKDLAKYNKKLGNLKSRRVFLLKCKGFGIYPNNIFQGTKIYNNLKTKSSLIQRKIKYKQEKTRNNLLNLEISILISD